MDLIAVWWLRRAHFMRARFFCQLGSSCNLLPIYCPCYRIILFRIAPCASYIELYADYKLF